jgi:hypothetical protein
MELSPADLPQQAHALLEPLSRSLALAVVEYEEITPETAAALARASLRRGEGIPHEEILREFVLR